MFIEPNENRGKYIAIAGMAACLIIGFFSAYFWMNAKVQKASKDCAASLAESQKKENGLTQTPKVEAPKEIFSISGKVENIDGQKIILKSFSFGEEKTFQVTVGDDTKIIKREMDMSSSKEKANGPATPKETEISLADLRVGDSLAIVSADNIKNKTEFTAKSINLELITGLPTIPAAPDVNSIPALPSAPDTSSVPDLPAPPAIPNENSTAPATAPAPPSIPALPIAPK